MSSFPSRWLASFFLFLFTRCSSVRHCSLYIQNNQSLHRRSNTRLALLQTVSLAFILFSACLLRLQTNTLYANIRLSIPSDLLVSSSTQLDKAEFTAFLQKKENQKRVEGFEFLVSPEQHTLSSYAQITTPSSLLYSLTPNYLDLMLNEGRETQL